MFSAQFSAVAFFFLLWDQGNGDECKSGGLPSTGQDKDCKVCGISDHEMNLIINGKEVTPVHKYPWIVPLIRYTEEGWIIYCGSSIISAKYTLTAAHCVYDDENKACSGPGVHQNCVLKPDMFKVGLMNTSTTDVSRYLDVNQIIAHPQYQHKGTIHDIALVELKERLACDGFERPVCVPRKPMDKMGQLVIIAGWGRFVPDIRPKGKELILREGIAIQVEPSLCQNTEELNSIEKIFCTLGIWNQTSCYGDSGSSVFGNFNNVFYSLGVTSRGQKGCPSDSLTTFANTYGYLGFIQNYVKDLPIPPA